MPSERDGAPPRLAGAVGWLALLAGCCVLGVLWAATFGDSDDIRGWDLVPLASFAVIALGLATWNETDLPWSKPAVVGGVAAILGLSFLLGWLGVVLVWVAVVVAVVVVS